MRGRNRRGGFFGRYDQNVGKAGAVYILENDGLRSGWFKIGCSSRSGAARAFDLNVDANTGTPGSFRCIFEFRTLDCGKAEQLVFHELADHRRGKRGQEFFEVDLQRAQTVIRNVCASVDAAALPPPAPPAPRPPPSAPTPAAPQVTAQPVPSRPAPAPAPQSQPRMQQRGALAPAQDFTISPAPAKSPIRLRWIAAALVIAVVWWNARQPSKAPLAPAPTLADATQRSAPSKPAQHTNTARPTATRDAASKRAAASSAPQGLPKDAATGASTLVDQAGSAIPLNSIQWSTAPTAPRNSEVQGSEQLPAQEEPAPPPSRQLTRADLRADERSSLEAVCASAKFTQGAVAYLQCLDRQLAELASAPRKHDLTGLGPTELQSLNASCTTARFTEGPAALNRCMARQLSLLGSSPRAVDTSGLSTDERTSLEASCTQEKHSAGPAAYNDCRRRHLKRLASAPAPQDTSWLSRDERSSLSAACNQAKFTLGPAAYRECVARQLAQLREAPSHTDLSHYPREVRTAIESACNQAKFILGPAEYNRCVARQVNEVDSHTAGNR